MSEWLIIFIPSVVFFVFSLSLFLMSLICSFSKPFRKRTN
uniref:Uncharacterized protein n=1 Tax=viral metagenome TaxID=1070528 RepID=A0A6C0ADA8_9ZZZZ